MAPRLPLRRGAMRLFTFPTPYALGGWGRLVRQRPDRRSYVDETGDRFAVDLVAEGRGTALRLERHRVVVPEPPGSLARTHATLAFLDEGTYAIHNKGRHLLVDPLTVAVFAPFAPFEVSHPHGHHHRGLSVFLSDDLFFGGFPPAVDRPWPMVVPASMRTLVLEQVLRRVARQREGLEKIDEAGDAVWRSVQADLRAASPAGKLALRGDTIERHEAAVVRARAYLANCHRGPVALAEVARAAFVSLYYLTRIFRRTTGTTVHGYLTRLRLRSALIGMADPRRLLDEVSTSVGYVSQSHFTKVVRTAVGLVPSELRQLMLEAGPTDRAFDRIASFDAWEVQDRSKPLSF